MIAADKLRTRIVEIATGFDGACGCEPYREYMTEALGFPIDWRPFRVVNGHVQGVSTCYVFALNVLRLAGVAIHNWHIGEPIGTMIAWAKRVGCWQEPGDGLAPDSGDVLFIGPRGGTHVCVVDDIALDPSGNGVIWTVDGGQVCERTTDGHDGTGRQMVAARQRDWDGTSVVGRRRDVVVGWVDVGRVRLRTAI